MVAEALGMKPVAFSERKTRNSAPVDKILLWCHYESINPDYILLGEGPATVAEPLSGYRVVGAVQELTPVEYEMIRIARECPEAVAVVRMMGAVDSDTQKDIQRGAEKEKLMFDLKKERQERKTA